MSHFFVGESAEMARDACYPYYQRYLSPKTNGGRGWHVDRAGMEQLAGPRGALMVGSAQEIAAKVLDTRATLGVDRFLGQVDLGGMPRQTMLVANPRRASAT